MKLTTVMIAAAALTGAATIATNAAANATVFEEYQYSASLSPDGAFIYVTNTGSTAFTDISISGGFGGGTQDFGGLAAGATTTLYFLGDSETNTPGSQGFATITITQGSLTFAGGFLDVLGDPDVTSASATTLGTIVTSSAVPEPAVWTLLLAGFGGLGAALRLSRRKSLVAV